MYLILLNMVIIFSYSWYHVLHKYKRVYRVYIEQMMWWAHDAVLFFAHKLSCQHDCLDWILVQNKLCLKEIIVMVLLGI